MSKLLVGLALAMGIILYFSFSLGFVLYKYWYWFVIDVFPNLPRITFYQAVGLKMFTGILIFNYKTPLKDELYKEDLSERLLGMFFYPWIAIVAGYFIYLFLNY